MAAGSRAVSGLAPGAWDRSPKLLGDYHVSAFVSSLCSRVLWFSCLWFSCRDTCVHRLR